MRHAVPPPFQCQPTLFGATKKGGVALALCGALILFLPLAEILSAQTPVTTESSSTPQPSTPPGLPLELRGILLTETGSYFGFYNLKNGRSTWIALGQPMDGFVVQSHDEGTDLITAEFQGHTFTMALKKTTTVESGLTGTPRTPGKSEAVRAELLNRKVLRLRAQKARMLKILAK